MDKLVFKVEKKMPKDRKLSYIKIMIDGKAGQVLEDLKEKTGLTYATIAEKMIEFASEHVKIEEVYIDFEKVEKPVNEEMYKKGV